MTLSAPSEVLPVLVVVSSASSSVISCAKGIFPTVRTGIHGSAISSAVVRR